MNIAKNSPTVSIALCTFNGERYLDTQLTSILEQTHLPDELIVCDDASTDRTVSLLEAFSTKAPFPVQIYRNPNQLGYNKNFENALSRCNGSVLFICDQDDYWFPEKIETLVSYLNDHPETDMVFTNAQLTNHMLQADGRYFWEIVRFNEATRQRWLAGEAMEVLLAGNRVMGCASALRQKLVKKALPVPNIKGYIYDGWIALVAAAEGRIHFLEKSLLLYRTHEKQQVGVRSPDTPQKVTLHGRFSRDRCLKLAPFQQKYQEMQTLLELLNDRIPMPTREKEQLRRLANHYATRATMPTNRFRRIGPVFREWSNGNYGRYADADADWKAPILAAVGDLLE